MQNSILWHFTLFAGMEAVGLKSFIEKYPKSVHILFPTVSEATILGAELKLRLRFEDETLEANRPVVDMSKDVSSLPHMTCLTRDTAKYM